jgi:carbonic anhydrase
VLGHTKCGAVTAVVKKAEVGGNITSLTSHIKPAVDKTRAENRGIDEAVLIEKSIRNNVFQSIEDIFKSSPEIRALVRDGKVRIIGALYDIESGKVYDLGVHLSQDALLRIPSKK